MLQTVSAEQLRSATGDPEFQSLLAEVDRVRRAAEEGESWFQHMSPHSDLTPVAYFSMEFMLGEALPIYSGGRGNVAGDQLKAASNMGVPLAGIGLLYQQGPFRQEIDMHGQQQALYPFNGPGQLPIQPLRNPDGEWLRLSIALPGSTLWIRTWQVPAIPARRGRPGRSAVRPAACGAPA
jgi:glycogen phosphorylase